MRTTDETMKQPQGSMHANGRDESAIGTAISSKTDHVTPNQAVEVTAVTGRNIATGKLICSPFSLLFIIHLLLILCLITFLTVRAFVRGSRKQKFNPFHEYAPLVVSTILAFAVTLATLIFTLRAPSKAVRALFWMSPLLSVAVSVLFLSMDSVSSVFAGVLAFIFAIVQSLYACWVTPRRKDCVDILSFALTATIGAHVGPGLYVVFAHVIGLIYTAIWIFGAVGVVFLRHQYQSLCVLALLLSMWWTMQVIRNVVHVAVCRMGYLQLTQHVSVDARVAFLEATTTWFADICLGSILVPIVVVFRGFARTMNMVSAEADEFLFSCAHCYMGVANRLVRHGNRWGFVHAGTEGKGFTRASSEIWRLFEVQGLARLIDNDLTASICFFSGVVAGALACLVCGLWAVATQTHHSISLYLYALLIGYFLGRIAMAGPQACVSAFIVAYAEDQQNPRFDPTITDRIRRHQVIDAPPV